MDKKNHKFTVATLGPFPRLIRKQLRTKRLVGSDLRWKHFHDSFGINLIKIHYRSMPPFNVTLQTTAHRSFTAYIVDVVHSEWGRGETPQLYPTYSLIKERNIGTHILLTNPI